MKPPTRKMWISAGVVGVVLVGGISVAAAASAGRVDDSKAGRGSEAGQTYAPGKAPGEIPGKEIPENAKPTSDPDKVVVSDDMNPNPKKVVQFWTEKRMESARPLPMPVITSSPKKSGK